MIITIKETGKKGYLNYIDTNGKNCTHRFFLTYSQGPYDMEKIEGEYCGSMTASDFKRVNKKIIRQMKRDKKVFLKK